MKVLPIGGNIIVPISSRRRKTVSPVSTITYIIVIITTKCAVLFFFRLSVDMWSYKAKAIHLNNSNRL